MNRLAKLSLGVLIAFLAYSHGIAFTVADDNTVGISITPIKWEITANPGDVIRRTVTAVNPNDFPLTVVPEFQDFRVLENAGIQWIPSDVENPYRMTDWIRITGDPITLKPKGQTDVPFSIVVPRNASVGGHYAAIFFRAVVDNENGNISSIPRVGALIIFNVNGNVVKQGEITTFSVSKFVDQGPVSFTLSLKNTGTTHYEPATEITIQNLLGPRTKISAEKGKLIYPGVSRSLKTEWNKKFPVGIYHATALFTDGDGTKHTASTWFIGFPWKYFLALFIFLMVIRWTWKYLRQRFKIIKVT